jgi:hypothetical protein
MRTPLLPVALALFSGCYYDLSTVPRPSGPDGLASDGGVDVSQDAGREPGSDAAPGDLVLADRPVEPGMEPAVEVAPEVAMEQAIEMAPEASTEPAPELMPEVGPEPPIDAGMPEKPLSGLGVSCGVGPECSSGFCVNGVCCGTACNSTEETACSVCNLPGKEGTCTLKCVCNMSCGVWSCSTC